MDELRKEELEDMYWDQGMTQADIAGIFDVLPITISRKMREFGIKSRTSSESKLINAIKLSEPELIEMYLEHRMSIQEVSDAIGVPRTTLSRRMREFGIERRTRSESLLGKYIGKNSSNWNGGTSFEPYCEKFNDIFKEAVRERDDYICQLCGHKQKSNGRKLDVHHIHYDRKNCWPDVVALCRSCNSKVNSNRSYWEQYFEDLLIEHGYFCWSINRIGDDA